VAGENKVGGSQQCALEGTILAYATSISVIRERVESALKRLEL
jgi:hypothetical protein